MCIRGFLLLSKNILIFYFVLFFIPLVFLYICVVLYIFFLLSFCTIILLLLFLHINTFNGTFGALKPFSVFCLSLFSSV